MNDVWASQNYWASLLFHPACSIAASVGYLVLVKGLIFLMKDKEPFWPSVPKTTEGESPKKKPVYPMMVAYNVIQVVLCTYMCYGLWYSPFSLTSPVSTFFRRSEKYTANAEYFVFVHYLSKWVDFVDTIFMALRKKERQITFLHLFHHSSIPVVWSMLLYTHSGYGTVQLGALINSFVHMVMYSHYFITSLGGKNPFKVWVTRVQLGQFYILFVHAMQALIYEEEIGRAQCFTQAVYQILMIWMFMRFYARSYGKKKKISNKKS